MEQRSDRRPIKENDLVSEQPGFFIVFLGLFFSIIVGISVRTAAESSWFRERLTEAISNVGSDWRIQHGNVGLYFKDGIKPTIGLYADNVKIASESSCYLKSGGFAQRVKIPLSLIKYIMDGQLVSEVEVQDFKIEVTEKTPVCNPSTTLHSSNTSSEGKKKNQISIVDRVERNTLRSEIEQVRINKLEIYYPDEIYDYFLLRDITIENRSVHPKILFMDGNIDLGAFVKTGEGQKLANLKIEYNEFPEKVIKTNLLGSLREGFFSVQLVNRIEDKQFQLQTELKNVSLSLLKGVFNQVPKDLNLKSNWLSLKLYAEGRSDQLKASDTEIKDVTVNGGLGEFTVNEIVFAKGVQNPPEPFEVRMKNVDLSGATQLIPGVRVPEQLDSLGVFNGQLTVSSESLVSLSGDLKDLGIVFSAHGVRKIEKLDVGKVIGVWQKNKIFLEAQDLENEYGKIDGSLKIKANGSNTFELEASLKDVHLTPAVSQLITRTDTPMVFDEISIKASSKEDRIDYRALGKLKSVIHQYFELFNVSFSVSGGTEKNQEIEVKADLWENTSKMRDDLVKWGVSIPDSVSKPRVKATQNRGGALMRFDSQSALRAGVTFSSNRVEGFIVNKDQEWKVYGTRDNFKIDKK